MASEEPKTPTVVPQTLSYEPVDPYDFYQLHKEHPKTFASVIAPVHIYFSPYVFNKRSENVIKNRVDSHLGKYFDRIQGFAVGIRSVQVPRRSQVDSSLSGYHVSCKVTYYVFRPLKDEVFETTIVDTGAYNFVFGDTLGFKTRFRWEDSHDEAYPGKIVSVKCRYVSRAKGAKGYVILQCDMVQPKKKKNGPGGRGGARPVKKEAVNKAVAAPGSHKFFVDDDE